jgi:hypothetical protein
MSDTRQHLHEMLDRLPQAQLGAVEGLLKAMLDDEELSAEDLRAIALSREYFREGGQGVSFEQVVAECGFTMDQIHSFKGK